MPDPANNPGSKSPSSRYTLIAAGLLLAALSLVVIYTTRGAFFSPLTLVVVAAIGLAALLLQLRLRPGLPSTTARGPLWLNGIGVFSALTAFAADFLHAGQAWVLIAALVAVVSFGASGIVVLSGLRKRRA